MVSATNGEVTPVPTTVMTPFGDRVVLKIEAEITDRPSTIILPQGARVRRDAPLMADVVDVGPDVRWVRAGMRVLVAALADGVEVSIPGSGFLRVVGEHAVIAQLSAERPFDTLIAERDRLNDEITERLLARNQAITAVLS